MSKVTYNVGLNGNPWSVNKIVQFFGPDRYKVVKGEWEGKEEQTLVLQWDESSPLSRLAINNAIDRGYDMTYMFEQEAVAVHMENVGGLLCWNVDVERNAEFDMNYFETIKD